MAINPSPVVVAHLGIALAVLNTVAVLIRILARWRSAAAFATDDVLVVLSLLPFFVMITLGDLIVQTGLGKPFTALTSSQIQKFLKLNMATLFTYPLTMTLVKISLLILYRRIFVTAIFLKKSLIVGILCVLWFFLYTFLTVFQCRPFHAAFDIELLDTHHCIDLQNFYWGISTANLALDIVMLYLPLCEVWKLNLRRKQKYQLSGIFLLGGLVCVAGAMRIVCIGYISRDDLTLTFAADYMWSQIEPAVAILCACIVTYRPLFNNLSFTKMTSLFSRSDHTTSTDEQWTKKGAGAYHQSQVRWPGNQSVQDQSHLRHQELSVKVAVQELPVIRVGLESPEPVASQTDTVVRGPDPRRPGTGNEDATPRSRYEALPMMVTEDANAVVDSFV